MEVATSLYDSIFNVVINVMSRHTLVYCKHTVHHRIMFEESSTVYKQLIYQPLSQQLDVITIYPANQLQITLFT